MSDFQMLHEGRVEKDRQEVTVICHYPNGEDSTKLSARELIRFDDGTLCLTFTSRKSEWFIRQEGEGTDSNKTVIISIIEIEERAICEHFPDGRILLSPAIGSTFKHTVEIIPTSGGDK